MNKLFVVATPIGNLDDVSKRMIETLNNVTVIYAEDTRHSKILLTKFNIETKVKSMHKFNESSTKGGILSDLELGDVAIISDAGTPTISDPGQKVVKMAQEMGIVVNVIPGPSAVSAALSICGFEFDSFTFVGFLPKSQSKINKIFEDINSDLIVFYESPKRINKTLEFLKDIKSDMDVSIVREMTKIYEEVSIGNPEELNNREYKGEIVVIVKNYSDRNLSKEMIDYLSEKGMSNKDIIDFMVKYEKQNKNEIYNLINKDEK